MMKESPFIASAVFYLYLSLLRSLSEILLRDNLMDHFEFFLELLLRHNLTLMLRSLDIKRKRGKR